MWSHRQTLHLLVWAVSLVCVIGTCVRDFDNEVERCTPLTSVRSYVKTEQNGKTVYELKPSFTREQYCSDLSELSNYTITPQQCEQQLNYEINNISTIDNCNIGVYGFNSTRNSVFGKLVPLYSVNDQQYPDSQGCWETVHDHTGPIPKGEPWIALIKRGGCNFDVKVANAMALYPQPVGLVIYTTETSPLQPMNHQDRQVMTVMVDSQQGLGLSYYSKIQPLYLNITKIPVPADCSLDDELDPPSKISVMIVAISFVAMMVISLAWLVFYYIQRHRNMMKTTRHNERLERAMRKALRRIGETEIKRDDQMTRSLRSDVCSYCLEGFGIGQFLRKLPCGHNFHTECVDQWLIKNRVCPNCKENVLISLGVKIKGIPDLEAAETDLNTTELAQINPDGTTAENNDTLLAASQLLTDGQNMYLYVPNDVNDRLEPGEGVHLQIDSEPVQSENSENPESTLLSHSQPSVTSQHASQHDVAV